MKSHSALLYELLKEPTVTAEQIFNFLWMLKDKAYFTDLNLKALLNSPLDLQRNTALHLVAKNKLILIPILITFGATADHHNLFGYNPLHVLLESLDVPQYIFDVAWDLIERGAAANSRNTKGETILHLLMTRDNLVLTQEKFHNYLKIFLKLGVNPAIKNRRWWESIQDILIDSPEIFPDNEQFSFFINFLLIKYGASTERCYFDSESILHWLVRCHLSLANKYFIPLLELGANPKQKNFQGLDVLQLLLEEITHNSWEYLEIVLSLLDAGLSFSANESGIKKMISDYFKYKIRLGDAESTNIKSLLIGYLQNPKIDVFDFRWQTGFLEQPRTNFLNFFCLLIFNNNPQVNFYKLPDEIIFKIMCYLVLDKNGSQCYRLLGTLETKHAELREFLGKPGGVNVSSKKIIREENGLKTTHYEYTLFKSTTILCKQHNEAIEKGDKGRQKMIEQSASSVWKSHLAATGGLKNQLTLRNRIKNHDLYRKVDLRIENSNKAVKHKPYF